MLNTETMTPAEALLWLAELEKKCPLVEGAMSLPFCESHCMCEHHKPWRCKVCSGTGKVSVLPDLREPCSCQEGKIEVFSASGEEYKGFRKRLVAQGVTAPHWYEHPACQGRGWLPKQEWDALYAAMDKDGWDCATESLGYGGARKVRFSRFAVGCGRIYGEDSDPCLAAVRAMKAVGSSR